LFFLFFEEDLLKLLPGICGCANLLGGNSGLALPDRLPVALIVAQRPHFGKTVHSLSSPALPVSLESLTRSGRTGGISWQRKVISQLSSTGR